MSLAVETYTIVFNVPLFPRQIQSFRKAIGALLGQHLRMHFQKAGISTDWFHNHDEETTANIHRYTCMQYKVIDRLAAVTAVGPAVPSLRFLYKLLHQLQGRAPVVSIDGRIMPLFINRQLAAQCDVRRLKQPQYYRMYHWLALNDEQFEWWKANPRLTERIARLDQLLELHIGYFLNHMGFRAGKKPEAYLVHLSESGFKKDFHYNRLAFSCVFAAHILLPEEIGLGGAVAIGYGKIQYLPQYEKEIIPPNV